MSSHGSKQVIYAALAGNLVIAVIKAGAAAATGSAAMLSEAIHSVVDTFNQWLMLLGIARSARPADAQHPFGHGREIYFWVFCVGLLVFAGGGAVSVAEGIEKILYPTPVESAWINYLVLGVAVVAEAISFSVALREFRTQKGDLGYLEAMRRSKDPTVFAVLLEDTAALAGLVVALVGILAAQLLHLPVLDGVASLVIGLILVGVAAFLVAEAKELLIGEAADPLLVEGIRARAASVPGVDAVNAVLTQHLGPQDVLVNLSLDFCDAESAGSVEWAVAALERDIKTAFPVVTRVFIEIKAG